MTHPLSYCRLQSRAELHQAPGVGLWFKEQRAHQPSLVRPSFFRAQLPHVSPRVCAHWKELVPFKIGRKPDSGSVRLPLRGVPPGRQTHWRERFLSDVAPGRALERAVQRESALRQPAHLPAAAGATSEGSLRFNALQRPTSSIQLPVTLDMLSGISGI